MADQSCEVRQQLQHIGERIRGLADHTLQAAAVLPPSDREEVRKSVMKMVTFSERLIELAITTGPDLAALRRGLGETPLDLLQTAIETLDRVANRTDYGADEPLN
jgi:hypothetical protein